MFHSNPPQIEAKKLGKSAEQMKRCQVIVTDTILFCAMFNDVGCAQFINSCHLGTVDPSPPSLRPWFNSDDTATYQGFSPKTMYLHPQTVVFNRKNVGKMMIDPRSSALHTMRNPYPFLLCRLCMYHPRVECPPVSPKVQVGSWQLRS